MGGMGAAFAVIAEKLPRCAAGADGGLALDLGCGSGASTEVLWGLGYRRILAVDAAPRPWEMFVEGCEASRCPGTVRFIAASDECFMAEWAAGRHGADWGCPSRRFDVINSSYSMRRPKARSIARRLLADDGRMLVPVHASGVADPRAALDVFTVLDSRGVAIDEDPGWNIEPDELDPDPMQRVRREGMYEATVRAMKSLDVRAELAAAFGAARG